MNSDATTAAPEIHGNPLLEPSGLPDFGRVHPEHVEPAVLRTLDENRQAIETLLASASASGTGNFEATVLPLEELGDRLHRVWSPVSHLHSVANTPALRAAYNACLPAITRYETELGHNRALYELYRGLHERAHDELPAGEGAARLLELAVRDFRLAGVHLPAEEKARFQSVMEELARCEATFEQNLLDSAAAWSLHITDRARVEGVPATTLDAAEAHAREAGQTGWVFQLDQPTYVAVLTHAADRDLRRTLYRAWVTRASDQADWSPEHDNTAPMERILALRHEAARLVGFAHYAEYSLATRMVKSVAEVREFLDALLRESKPAATRELEELANFAGTALEPWDIPWWSEKLRHHRYSISDEELRPYFPLERVLAGLFEVVHRLYGIRIEAVDGAPVWDDSVSFYRLVDGECLETGGFYVDWYARPGKRSGAWMDQCLNRLRSARGLQRPVAHLVCNFAKPTADRPTLLTHDEVVTLFHEMGHVLHHLLTRIDFPSVSGINGVPWDAVELPSQFMETFAWEPAVVALCSGHYESGEPLPGTVLENLRASRNFQAGLQMVRQLEFALFDLRLHAEYDPARPAGTMELLDEVRKAVAVVRAPEWNRFAHGFSHIFGGGYAAGYYSYKWAEVLAADAFEAFETQGLFDPDLARRFREEVLEIGGSRDIGEAYERFRGRPAEVSALLRQSGIAGGQA